MVKFGTCEQNWDFLRPKFGTFIYPCPHIYVTSMYNNCHLPLLCNITGYKMGPIEFLHYDIIYHGNARLSKAKPAVSTRAKAEIRSPAPITQVVFAFNFTKVAHLFMLS